MKFTAAVTGLIFVGVFGWFIGSRLSADAIGMAVGILFGILAGIPAALMVMASRQQADRYSQSGYPPQKQGRRGQIARADQIHYGAQPQPPVIIFAGNPMQHQSGQSMSGQNAGGYNMGGYNTGSAQAPQNQYIELTAQPSSESDHRQFRVVGETEEWVDGW